MIAFLDIETIPANQQKKKILTEVYKRKNRDISFERFCRSTSLNGNWGQIICIGVALDEGRPQICTGTEEEILTQFWALVQNAQKLVGHNVLNFDLPFIFKRSVINNVKPTLNLKLKSEDRVYDTMREWDGWTRSFTGLDQLAKILGFKSSKNQIDGSKVWYFYRQGRLETIYNYCLADVELTRKIYYRLTFDDKLEDTTDHYLELNQVMEF